MDINNPELTRIFRAELGERSGRLVAGARSLRDRRPGQGELAEFARDAHTIKGSAGLLGLDALKEVAARLESVWQLIAGGFSPPTDLVVAMEAAAGRMVPYLDDEDPTDFIELGEKLAVVAPNEPGPLEVVPTHATEPGSLGGLLSSVSESLLGGATRVDTGHLYRLINRIVEVALDADALADLSLVSIEGSDPEIFRRSWRSQMSALSGSITDIQDQAVALADVSFHEAVATFPQFIRYLGRRMDKDVRFELEGDEVQLDRQIVDLLRDPLRHLVVNAVDHGIEDVEVRIAAGKPATGTVKIFVKVVAERVEVSVSDDGAGIDWDTVAEIATKKGIPFVPNELTPVLFEPEFTTADDVTDFSGSGEGLAAARDAVEQVHGVVDVDSIKGHGTNVVLNLPLSMVLQNVVVVATGEQFWGIPEAYVEAAMPLSKAEIRATGSGRELRFESNAVPCVSLSEAVGAEPGEAESELLVVSTRAGLLAVTVSELIDRRRVAVKNLGPILEGPGHVTGAALLGGGQVLVVLDPNFLGLVARDRPQLAGRKPRVLVVDDSAGVRQLLSATLNGAGFDVDVAGGARQAVLAMAEEAYDAMVIDYSMPRSNGVELVRAMRASEVTVPIVMVSGVATSEEKQAAWEVGVDAYIDKFDLRQGVLTSTLKRLIGIEEAADTA